MARILIFQEKPGAFQALRKSLEPHHELIFAHSQTDAMHILQATPIDLIISRVHLEGSDVFKFIQEVKGNSALSPIPLICFSGRLTPLAKSLDSTLANATSTIGADKYISLHEFCADGKCDFERLRKEVESTLPHPEWQG